MASELFIFYDICAVAVALVYLYIGAKRGLLRSVVFVLLTAASIALSWLACTVATPIIYDNVLRKPIISALDDSSSKTDPVAVVSSAVSRGGYGVEMTDSEVESVISRTGDFFSNIAGEIKNNGANESAESIESGLEKTVTDDMLNALIGDVVSPRVLSEILETVSDAESSVRSVVGVFLEGDKARTADAVESTLIAPAVKMILRGIIWVVSMFILMFLSRLIANAFKGVNKVPIIGPVNSLMGAALGLAEGLVVIYLISQVVKVICYFSSNSLMFLNTDTVRNTYIFKYFFYFTPSQLGL